MTALVFLDTETTSLDPRTRLAWEFACLRREPGMDDYREDFFLEVSLEHADPMSLKFGKFYDRHPLGLQYGLSLNEKSAAARIDHITRDAVIVGMNPMFDMIHLEALLRRNGRAPRWHYRPIDVETVGFTSLAPDDRPAIPWKSDNLAELCGLDPTAYNRHSAMGDVELTRDWYDLLIPTKEPE